MNMDPDPSLFDVQMPEMSTAEEEELKESLSTGMDVVSNMMSVVDGIVEGDDRELDKIEIFHYLNEKILKLEDFDLKDFIVASKELPECKRRTERMAHEQKIKKILEKAMKDREPRLFPKPVLWSTDLMSYVPTRMYKDGKVNEKAVRRMYRKGGFLGAERSSEVWESKFGNTMVMECDPDKDVNERHQMTFEFGEEDDRTKV